MQLDPTCEEPDLYRVLDIPTPQVILETCLDASFFIADLLNTGGLSYRDEDRAKELYRNLQMIAGLNNIH